MTRVILLAVVLIVLAAPSATAEPLFEVLGAMTGEPANLSPYLDLFGPQFDVVVLLHSDSPELSAAEFVVDELLLLVPGIFKLATVKLFNSLLTDIGDNSRGEYVMGTGQCVPIDTPVELVRVSYGDFGGYIGPNTDLLITVRGLQPGDTQPSNFGGSPGFVDCMDVKFAGAMGGHDELCTGAGIFGPEGSMIINPTPFPCPAGSNSFGAVKCRY